MKSALLNSFYYGKIFLMILLTSPLSALESCDISDLLTRPLIERSIFIWSLLDLAENATIVNYDLFYDELCQSTLRLCKEVQQLQESQYILSAAQLDRYTQLFSYLQSRFNKLPEHCALDTRYINAITIILHYSDYFLKNNLGVDSETETA